MAASPMVPPGHGNEGGLAKVPDGDHQEVVESVEVEPEEFVAGWLSVMAQTGAEVEKARFQEETKQLVIRVQGWKWAGLYGLVALLAFLSIVMVALVRGSERIAEFVTTSLVSLLAGFAAGRGTAARRKPPS